MLLGIAAAAIASAATSADVQRLEARLESAKAALSQAQELAHRGNPRLAAVEREKEQLAAWYEKERVAPRLEVSKFLRDHGKENAGLMYRRLKTIWHQAALAEAFGRQGEADLLEVYVMNSPLKEQAQEALRRSKAIDAEDPAAIVKWVRESYSARLRAFHFDIVTLDDKSGFPEAIKAQAREDGETEFRMSLLEGYLAARTPLSLRKARADVRNVEVEIANARSQSRPSE